MVGLEYGSLWELQDVFAASPDADAADECLKRRTLRSSIFNLLGKDVYPS